MHKIQKPCDYKVVKQRKKYNNECVCTRVIMFLLYLIYFAPTIIFFFLRLS